MARLHYCVRRWSVLATAALILAGAGAGTARAEIKIGVFGPMTGDAAGYGQSLREAVDLVVKERNAAGGLLGQQITVIYGDDAGKPEQAVSVAKRLTASDEVLIMLGSISSPASLAASQVAKAAETPQIVISGTAQKITTQGNKWVFRSAIPDTKFAADLVDFINEKFPGKKKVGFIYVNDDFGKGGFEGFKARAQGYGMQVVAEERYTRGDLDFTSQLSRIKASGADFIVDWSRYAEGALIIKQIKQMGIDMPYFGSDGQAHPKFRELAGAAADGAYYPTHFSVAAIAGNKVAEDLTAKIRAAYKKDPDYVHAQAYDAMTATAMAVQKAGTPDRAKVRDALATVEFDGVRGHFKFDEKGDPTLKAIVVIIKNGQEANAR
ncbi:MAG TPA: ABC transporter substrate-binding protein [Xanthobacteraceae bacterium]|jgi:branched-chain amino acid transport system substrate-binding protein